VYYVQVWVFNRNAYRDKVVGVFVRFSCAASLRMYSNVQCTVIP
jgi:hypothetical protein